jgi:hypothetical protein
MHLSVIERLSWSDSVKVGDELQLQIEILDERTSITGLTSWVRWKWTLATAAGAQVLDLTAGSLLDRSPTKSESGVPTINRISYKVADAADIVGLSKYVRCRAGTN